MNILLVYPKHPETIWSFKHALKFISKKASVSTLGLLTVSAMLPNTWIKKPTDINVSELKISNLLWADYVFISAMYVQKESVDRVIKECEKQNKKIVAGGPLFTQEYKNYPQIDRFVLNKAEITLPQFLNDLEEGNIPKKLYQTEEFADMRVSPVPDFHLLEMKKYASINIQFSRGCPFSCDFCEITTLLGYKMRMKQAKQVINELEALYPLNWHGAVAIIDDNFIGNKNFVKNDLLPAMKKWMQKHDYPFNFNIQSSINLADDLELMKLMTETGFDSAFIGIETPAEQSLTECNKAQNTNRDMLSSIKTIQNAGIQLSGGFIVGFDSDLPGIFQRQIDFIQQSGIVSAMIGLLNAPKNTKLYKRLKAENRLTTESSGNNADFSMNFRPKMQASVFLDGYKKIISDIYTAKPFYKRVRKSLLNYKKQHSRRKNLRFSYLIAFFKSILIIGILNRGQKEFWKNLLWTLFRRPGLFIEAVTMSVYGYHFRTVYGLGNSKTKKNENK